MALRAYLRQRERLIEYAASHIQHMQKALTQMNVQLHHVVSDITGATGMRIVRAIVAGDRDPVALARHRDGRCKASPETIRAALVGNYREEHVFALRQALELYDVYQALPAFGWRTTPSRVGVSRCSIPACRTVTCMPSFSDSNHHGKSSRWTSRCKTTRCRCLWPSGRMHRRRARSVVSPARATTPGRGRGDTLTRCNTRPCSWGRFLESNVRRMGSDS